MTTKIRLATRTFPNGPLLQVLPHSVLQRQADSFLNVYSHSTRWSSSETPKGVQSFPHRHNVELKDFRTSSDPWSVKDSDNETSVSNRFARFRSRARNLFRQIRSSPMLCERYGHLPNRLYEHIDLLTGADPEDPRTPYLQHSISPSSPES